MVKKGLR